MADIEPPSFSLGLDLDNETESLLPTLEPTFFNPAQDSPNSASLHILEDDGDELEQQVLDSDPEPELSPPRLLKRLRRGAASENVSANEQEPDKLFGENGVEEIEEFSSQEDLRTGEHPSTRFHSVCSSSKVSLSGRVLATQSLSLSKARKKEQPSVSQVSTGPGTNQSGLTFPRLTVSPLRMFQLLDSDSDNPSVSEDISREANKTDPSSSKELSRASNGKGKAPMVKRQTEDLWKDFFPLKSSQIPTPAFDEICEEYFQSSKDKDVARKVGNDVCLSNNQSSHLNADSSQNQQWDSTDPRPPAHHYFFHDDPRIRILVRNRLPNFSPLFVNSNQQPSASVIDYKSQFSNGEASIQKRTQRVNGNKSSTRGRSRQKKSNAGVSHASEGWIDPKSCGSIPKDAAKRRVHANAQSAGHWYTSPEGRKVYVSKKGQELTGQMAYRHYRKESGAGFRKSKRKTSAKKKKG